MTYESPVIPRSLESNIVSRVRISTAANVDVWADEATIRAYSTWQLQQLRRAARHMGCWRDDEIRREELLRITRDELSRRERYDHHDPLPTTHRLHQEVRTHRALKECFHAASQNRLDFFSHSGTL